MSDQPAVPVPTWYWIVAGVAMVWNLLGVMAYVMQVTMSPEAMAALPEAERALYEATPAWATAAFAIAVFGGALGCLGLLLRKGWAVNVLIVSLLAILVQMFHSFFMSESFEVFGPGQAIMPMMVIVVAVYLIWHARTSRAKGWIS